MTKPKYLFQYLFCTNPEGVVFAGKIKGAAIPSGSQIELTTDSIPRLVRGHSFKKILKPNSSFSTHHHTLKGPLNGKYVFFEVELLDILCLSLAGIDSSNSLSLLIHFVKLKPALNMNLH